jgi:hypothetical protein
MFILKLKKYRVRCFIHSLERVIDKFPHGERFFSPCGKNLSPYAVNPPTENKQIIISQLPHGEILRCKGQKRVANLGDFFPYKKNTNLRVLWVVKKFINIEHYL